LRQEGNVTAVWVLDKASMTVKSQVIQVATADGNDVVVAGGLQPGMLVVSAGVHVLSPGQKVSLYQPAAVSDTTSPAQTAPGAVAVPVQSPVGQAPASAAK
jgi:membrane fusion protein, multidrug efflux system